MVTPIPNISGLNAPISVVSTDPRIDENAKKLDSETDVAKRVALANETAKIIWENVMTLPLYQRPELFAVKTKLANYGAFGLSNPQWENVGYEK